MPGLLAKTISRGKQMKVFRSAWSIRIARLSFLLAGFCYAAQAGSILVPNAGVEVFRSWGGLTEGFSSVEHVGSSRIVREGGAFSYSYGLTGTLLLGLDGTITRLSGKEAKTG